ncbi:MAG: family 16 glycosylhydrolase [Rubrivivax sp.]
MNLFEPLSGIHHFWHTMFLRLRVLLPKQKACAFGPFGDDCRSRISDIYVINLDRQPQRLVSVARELDRIVDCTGQPLSKLLIRHAACDAQALPAATLAGVDIDPHYTLADQLSVDPYPQVLPDTFDLTRPIRMSNAEIAVAQSHIDIWKRIASSKAQYALVLEDDVWFEHGFGSLVDTAWEEMRDRDGSDPDFDLLYLSFKEVKHGAPKIALSRSVFRPERGLWYLSGYVLSKRGAQRLLASLPCRGPVDLWINQQFPAIDVRALRRSVIPQRVDLLSTNSYSVLPVLSQIGVLSDATPGTFHQRPTETPVFAFGSRNAGLSALAVALSMLGYRCCSDVDDLPPVERDRLLRGQRGRVFDAYVNVVALEPHIPQLKARYPAAKFIIVGEVPENFPLPPESVLHQRAAPESWTELCEYLRMPPPSASYPFAPERGVRRLRTPAAASERLARGKRLKHDASPWVAPPSRHWHGIDVELPESGARSVASRTWFEDHLSELDASRWLLRDDTFPGNLALFRPGSARNLPSGGLELVVASASLGVRELSAGAVSSRGRFLYGRFEATLRATNVSGLVSGFFLHRDLPRQEIDVEITGNRPDHMLVNVFFNPGCDGAKFDYGYRGTPFAIALGFDASAAFHTYAIEWAPNEIRWFVDHHLVHRRVLWDPTPIPDLPMTLHVNTWPTRSEELAGKLARESLPAFAAVRRIAVDANRTDAQGDTVSAREDMELLVDTAQEGLPTS